MPKSKENSTVFNEKPQALTPSSTDIHTVSVDGKKHTKNCSKTTNKFEAIQTPSHASKQSIVLTLLERPEGATIDEIAKVTGWKRHSVQGMMSGVLKKQLRLTVTSSKESRGRVYRANTTITAYEALR